MSKKYNDAFKADPAAFMRKYSVLAPDTVGSKIGDEFRTAHYDKKDIVFTRMPSGEKLTYLNFEKTPRTVAISMGGGKGGGTMAIDGSFSLRPDTVRSFFLPWNAGTGIIRLAIPPLSSVVHPQFDARYFFTAAINGCSVFIKGTQQAPTIYHAGGSTGYGSDPEKAAGFWKGVMNEYTDPLKRTNPDRDIEAEINKLDYISSGNTKTGFTPHIEKFAKWLKNNSPTDLQVERVEPWGCVMGVRDNAGDWTFYLQENIKITHHRFTKKHLLSKKVQVAGTQTESSRPMLFRQFYPGGLPQINFKPSMPRTL